MLKMKRNVQFGIQVEAGTNVEMTDEVFEAEIAKQIARAEQTANGENVRFHFIMDEMTPLNVVETSKQQDVNVEAPELKLNAEAKELEVEDKNSHT